MEPIVAVRRITVACLLGLLTAAAVAQDCATILAAGIVDRTRAYSKEEYARAAANSSCDRRSAGGSYKMVGGNYSQNICKYQNENAQGKRELDLVSEAINPLMAQALLSCVAKPGLHVWVEHTPDPDYFFLNFRFVGPANCTPTGNAMFRCAEGTFIRMWIDDSGGYPGTSCIPQIDAMNNTYFTGEKSIGCKKGRKGPILVTFTAEKNDVAPSVTKIFIP